MFTPPAVKTLRHRCLHAGHRLAGQAWGAHNYRACGVNLQRCLILTLLLSTVVALLWPQAQWLLLAIGQDPTIARGAARYLLLATSSYSSASLNSSSATCRAR